MPRLVLRVPPRHRKYHLRKVPKGHTRSLSYEEAIGVMNEKFGEGGYCRLAGEHATWYVFCVPREDA